MSLSAWLNRPDTLVARIWRTLYDGGYQVFKGCVMFILTPIYRIRRVGPRPRLSDGGAILCPNHASYLDPAFVQLTMRRRLTFIMTNDFYAIPAGRWFFRLVGAVPVGRGRLGRQGLRRAMALVKRGHTIVLFPEGSLSRDGHQKRAQRGIGRIARRTGAPVIPVGIAGAFHAWSHGSSRPGPARVRVAYGAPLRWKDMGSGHTGHTRSDEQAFADCLMDRIASARAGIHRDAPAPGDIRREGRPPKLQATESSGR